MKDLLFFLKLALRQHLIWVVGGILLTLLSLAAGTALLGLSGWFVSATALAGLAGLGTAFNLLVPSAGVRFFAVTRILSRYAERLVTHEATFRVLADLRVWFFRKAIPLAPTRLRGLRSGDLVARVTSDIEALDNLYLRGLAPASAALLLTLLASIFLAYHEVALGLVLLLSMLAAGVGAPLATARLARRPGRTQAEAAASLRSTALDGLRGAPELLAHDAAARATADLDAEGGKLTQAQRRQAAVGGLGGALIQLCTGLGLAALLWLAAAAVEDGRLSPPLLAMGALLLLGVFEAAGPLAQACQSFSRTHSAAARLRALAEMSPAVLDAKEPRELPPGGDIRFEAIRFAYAEGAPPVLRGLDLSVAEGERVAIIGESGSGKSTIAQLLLRLWDPNEGGVRIADTDLRHVPQASVHERIAFLSQETEVFSGSLRDNLLLANAAAEEAALWEALRRAGLANFASALPEGLDTWIGETGLNLSGGEARRLALARALLKPAAILLLDEPTQGLDAEAERAFFDTVADAAEGRTLLLITHATNLGGRFDRVLSLEEGRLVESRGSGQV